MHKTKKVILLKNGFYIQNLLLFLSGRLFRCRLLRSLDSFLSALVLFHICCNQITDVRLYTALLFQPADNVCFTINAEADRERTIIGTVVAVQLSEVFSTDMRYTASGMCYNFSFALFGGTAPYVATWLTANTGSYLSPAIYVTVLAVFVIFWVILFVPETANKPLRRFHTDPQYDKENFNPLIATNTNRLDMTV